MIVTCTVCDKVFVEDSVKESVEEHFNNLSKRMAKHVKLKHPAELQDITEAQANFVGLMVLLMFDSEDPWFTKEKERIREEVSQDIQADFDPFFAGAVATCYYLRCFFTPEHIQAASPMALKESLMEKFEVTEDDIEEYGKALAESEKEEEEEEDATEGEQTKL